MRQVQAPAERITAMQFSPDGHRLAAACWGGAITIYQQQQQSSPPDFPAATAADFNKCETLETAMRASDEVGAAVKDCDAADPGPAVMTSLSKQEDSPVAHMPAQQPPGTCTGELHAAGVDAASEHAVHVPADVQGAAEAQRSEHLALCEAPEAAHESRLAAVDHGVLGTGGWRPTQHVGGKPVKPGVTGPTLLCWESTVGLLVARSGGTLEAVDFESGAPVITLLLQHWPCRYLVPLFS
jgi:hypothetical protein